MKAGPRRREAATGLLLDPTTALMEWMPDEMMQSIAHRIPESLAETGQTGLPLIAEAMARGLSLAHEGIAEAENMSALRFHLKTRDWIRDAVDMAHGETIFTDFLRLYEEALVRHSEPAIGRALEEVPAANMLGLYLFSSRNGGASFGEPGPEGMLVLGRVLGMGALQVSLSSVHYGTEAGLFREGEFGLTPALKAHAERLGSRPWQDFELVDAGTFEMLRGLEGLRHGIENDWGSIHPLVRGFRQGFEGDPWVREQGVERIQRAVDEVEDFVTKPRH